MDSFYNEEEMYSPATEEEKRNNEFFKPSVSYWHDAWNRIRKDKMALTGLIIIIVILLFAIFSPIFCKYTYDFQDLSQANQWPSAQHIFGTDNLGRDLFVRTMYGARISLSIGFVASFISLTIGVLYGGISGLLGGKADIIMMRIVDILYSIPSMIYVILLMVIIGPGLKSIFLTLGISYWVGMARIVRGEILKLKHEEFVLAAQVIGASKKRILLRELIPNAMGPIIVTLTLSIPGAIFNEAFLSFVGLGVSAPMASWGVLTNQAISSLEVYPYQLFFPAAAITITILAFNFLGDGLRDALDPRLKR
ncbi:oligopeptide transport system permease protein OppC [Clostridium pasteurianum DSM 525 = ATCC 6013]|uniref:ABC-type transporter, integral membrane subunit n=1 Tax=Clostridium pasteurianum DSM 525 = ATCC 6013 TaxID=1262449 RepID=A0A0H3J011_CLOPA|nr:ABC transporter permease [Clostridium pasteurianum]AJA47151.1 oligopeptide transport system permease protein OppC [Clostridium pasteurianum DSM 525 = ATCC 6013]AJA51139.1 oligopeptide transport system permease protein OppC [Clostridium pasteurianum DSM 525 = ATCC 6013]AOZ74510.1 diguanylate cyclase [Clostridium pasteurianum DSM 525 = ATCC 6013]AOZ78307.1 diguanylate cyclase [Clostridium pasteurianum]ELP59462.1 oligopeptide ABC transporter membrane protein [Clostridium pasteurianum DSM 525 =